MTPPRILKEAGRKWDNVMEERTYVTVGGGMVTSTWLVC